ncbi:MAG: MerR family transcriptional regulator [Proteobacteria bacterium]|nr:MerR family transcriptional regulator [Pseudomonadota bacterium]
MNDSTIESDDIMTIGELCNELGISTRTLRYWEEEGIIESVERLDRGNRGYDSYMVRRIKFILKLKDLGLTIKELQNLYRVYGDAKKTDQLIPELINILDVHIDLIDDKVAKLSSLRKEIVEYRQKMSTKLRESAGC